MTFPLLKTHRLVKNESGVWMSEERREEKVADGAFPYEKIREILESVQDLSSSSVEMERRIPEHETVLRLQLDPRRANIVRGLNLKGAGAVLELGCGCGAVTRYLGEAGFQVDAVEDCPRKAGLAALRCRGLENVNVVSIPFPELEMPEKAYRAIFVLGLADDLNRRFLRLGDAETAAVEFFSRVRPALEEKGLLVVAADNRFGLKFWLGAAEGHSGTPYTGLYGYPKKEGRETFDLDQWGSILKKAGFQKRRFLFPFPDYCLPKAILSDAFLESDPFAYSMLYRVESRDYLGPWSTDAYEFFVWKALHRSGRLAHYANSFLIAAGASDEILGKVIQDDFVFFSDSGRRPAYRTLTRKPSGLDRVVKQATVPQAVFQCKGSGLKHSLHEKPYYRGILLSEKWLEAVFQCRESAPFEVQLKSYHDFVAGLVRSNGGGKNVDLLPFNIVVGEDGNWRVIDDEWILEEPVSPEFLLFRALLWFGKSSEKLLKPIFDLKGITNLRGFVAYGFRTLSLEHRLDMEDFIEREERLQSGINFQRGLNNIRKMVEASLFFPDAGAAAASFSAQLFWSGSRKDFSEERSVYVSGQTGVSRQVLAFPFNVHGAPLAWLKLKPANRLGFFTLYSLTVKRVPETGIVEETLLRLENPKQIADSAILENVLFTRNDQGEIFSALNPEPYLLFKVTETISRPSLEGFFILEAEMDWPKTPDFILAQKALAQSLDAFSREREKYLSTLKEKEDLIQEEASEIVKEAKKIQVKDQILHQFQAQVFQEESHIIRLEAENQKLAETLESLKTHPWWRGLRAFRKGMLAVLHLLAVAGFTGAIPGCRAYRKLKKSPLFDPSYYRLRYPEVGFLKKDPLWDYIRHGATEGRNTHPLFDASYYLQHNSDVKESGIDPLQHFLENGDRENRKPSPLFDPRYYRSAVGEQMGEKENSLEHFLQKGAPGGFRPNPLFDPRYYREKNPDVALSGINPLVHFLETGALEERNPHPLFETSWYLSNGPESLEAGQNPLVHYLEKGGREGKSPSPVFDAAYYLRSNPEVAASAQNPLVHYLTEGAREGKNPNPVFDTAYYLAQCSGTLESGANPLVHYLEKGEAEGLNPGPLFGTRYYLRQNPDVAESGVNPLAHFLQAGGREGRNPCSLFDSSYYFSKNPEVSRSGQNPLVHYLEKGGREGKSPSPVFDAAYYLRSNPEVAASAQNPLVHYLTEGAREGKNPNPVFDTAYYLAQSPEALQAGENPLVHYLEKGEAEGLNPGPLFDTRYYLRQNPDVRESGVNPLAHYLEHGWKEARDPNPAFRSDYYLREALEALMEGQNPLVHFIEVGAGQGKNPCSFFDTLYYMSQNPEAASPPSNPLAHYLQYGIPAKKKPNPLLDRFIHQPLITLIVDFRGLSRAQAQEFLDSLCLQIYRNWESILVFDAEDREELGPVAESAQEKDARIRGCPAEKGEPLPEALNRALSTASGEFLLFLKQVAPRMEALFEYVRLVNRYPDVDLLFCDQQIPGVEGVRVEDSLFAEPMLEVNHEVGPFILFRKAVADRVGGLKREHTGPWDFDFLLNCIRTSFHGKFPRLSMKLFDRVY